MNPRFADRIPAVRRLLQGFEGIDRAIPLFWGAFFLINLGTGVWALVLNLLLLEHGFRPDLIGAVTSFQTFGSAALAIPASRLAGKLGERRSFLLAGGIVGVTYLGQAAFPQPVPELAFSFLCGAALSLQSVTMVPFLSSRAPSDRRNSIFATSYVVQAMALMLGSLLGGHLPGAAAALVPGGTLAVGYAVALFAGGTVSLLSLASLWRLPAGAAVHLRPRIVPPARVADRPMQADRSPFRGWGPVIFAGIGAIMATSYGLSGPFFNVYLSTELHVPPAEIGTVFFAASLVGVPATMLGPVLARTLGSAGVVAVGRGLSVPFLALIPIFPAAWVVGTAYVLRNASASMAWPMELAFWTDRLPPREQARATAYRTTATNLCWGLAGMAGGQIILRVGYTPIFLTSAVLMTVVTAIYLLVFRQRPAAPAVAAAAS